MKLSTPIHRLKRSAKSLSRESGIPHHAALDTIAVREGFKTWSLLSAKARTAPSSNTLYARLRPGELVLIGARPGQGKTLMGLALAVEAMKRGHRAIVFSLENTRGDVMSRVRKIWTDHTRFEGLFNVDCSDAINADHIARCLHDASCGTMVIIDYLQLLDQRRENPDLMAQIRSLDFLARDKGLIMVFISQIDRVYDPSTKPCPDLGDVRLPNPLDLSLFRTSCFLQGGQVRFSGTG